MPESTFKYCPMCAEPLAEKHIFNILRSTCPSCGFILFLGPKLVTVVVIEHEGKLLLGRRNMNPAMGMWSFFGGYVDRGEKVEEAALREVKEETNLDVHLDALLGIYSQNGSPHVLIAYRASIVNNDISALAAQPDEMSELAFFSLEEIPELAFPFDMQILHDWRSIKSQGMIPEEIRLQLSQHGFANFDEVPLREALETHVETYTLIKLANWAARRWKCRYRLMMGDAFYDAQSPAEAYAMGLAATLEDS